MSLLRDQHIILGITGGIAAYKAAELARRLKDEGALVQVVMTDAAKSFISPLTMQAVSGRAVRDTLLDPAAEAGMGHIELGRWADLVLVAPTSADFIAKLANGMASDLLSTVCLATSAPVFLAPAMNQAMWQKPATQRNVTTLQADGIMILGPTIGDQACGDVGPGRMMEPHDILNALLAQTASGSMQGLNVVITAGPTWEALDPVRGLSNHSSGKMGYAVASAAAAAGANVHLISGPTALTPPKRVRLSSVRSAEEMFEAVQTAHSPCDIFIGVAAVADYRPQTVQTSKIKKNDDRLTLELVKNPDILSWVATQSPRPFTVGFAAETDQPIEHARNKRRNKGLDLIAVNQVGEALNPFGSDENQLVLIGQNEEIDLGRKSKAQLAIDLIETIAKKYHEQHKT
ncbi:MAG: bifunctional phosphopantothenoylcysteine decarboxylase/phosphopantothenate--cysteine ligase CoaBC [Gammaproteobacteria bacterium]|nr:bifunctional phosphopantothenoylcysteine decarboxylase/phosphopantothenate--cysteine ligase CoaBC [Gammaproteobacteria bacterium]NDG43288.1 bifunctional phosphopantothenoylcysteine decarboxylase/phosphopantothenate--cysteine ligase CoaBC [Gammaproteobacteria bacterium]